MSLMRLCGSWRVGIEGHVAEISPLTAEVVYYAAREALRNASKHGRMGEQEGLQITMRLTWNEGITLHIEDNGPGLEKRDGGYPAQHGGAGQGLHLHTTMLAVVGGELTLESQAGHYTRVVIYVPAASLFLRQ